MPINNNEWHDDCKVCGVRIKRPRADMLCRKCRFNYKRRVAYSLAHPSEQRPQRLCEGCGGPINQGNRSGFCRHCWKRSGSSIARATAEKRFAATLAKRPPGWLERLDRLAARAAKHLPLFG